MDFKVANLLSDLKRYVTEHILFAESLMQVSEEKLQAKKDEKSWSALECLEHLNLYAEFYNPEITKRIAASTYSASTTFTPGYLGNKFTMDMLPKKGMRTMNTFKSKNPIYSRLHKEEVLQRFIAFQKELLILLEKAGGVDLTKTKTNITLPFIKFRLGDTFRFVIYHNERHIVQAKKAL